jgi:molecular chaperone GrpE
MTTMKDRFARWSRISNNERQNAMSTEQIQDNDINDHDSSARVDVEAGTESQDGGVVEVDQLRAEVDQLRSGREQLAQQLVQAQDRLARLQAEFDNARKREIKERQDARDYAVQSTVEPFLSVMDNFALALKADGDVKQLRHGVDLILKQMDEALRSLNVQAVPTIGEQFDPRVHEALGSIESPEHPDHQVLEEIRRGYKLRDKLLRPALVRIATNSAQVSE